MSFVRLGAGSDCQPRPLVPPHHETQSARKPTEQPTSGVAWEKSRRRCRGGKRNGQERERCKRRKPSAVNARLLLSNSQNVQSAGANKRHGGQRRFGNCVPLKSAKQHRP